MILVTGATGNAGSAVVAELKAKGERFRAFVRDEKAAAARLGSDVELAVGDFEDADSITRALEGVDAIVLSSANQPRQAQHEIAVIDAAAAAGVRKIVKLSTVLAETGSPLPPFDWHGQAEDHLRAADVRSVLLHSTFHMTNFLAMADPIRQMGKLFAPVGDAKIAMIDPRDTGAVAAVAVSTDAYDGETLQLTGPESVTFEMVAKQLSAATGRVIDFVDIPDEAAHQSFVASGLPEWLITHFDHLFPLLRSGAISMTTDTVRAVTGREPRTFAVWAGDNAAAFGPQG